MQVVDGPLVEYFESCRSDLRRAGFHVLILGLVREADAPSFYDDLLRYWDSINDVTGRHVVFAVAGRRACEQVGTGTISGEGSYSEHMAIAERNTYRIEQLRQLAGRRNRTGALLESIPAENTDQISRLCEHLKVEERSLPCLHLTHLHSGKSLIIPLAAELGSTVYTYCKGIVSHLQSSFRAFDEAGTVKITPEKLALNKEKAASELKQKAVRVELVEIEQSLRIPDELEKLNRLFDYFRNRLSERPEFTPLEIAQLLALCAGPVRGAVEKGQARDLVNQLNLIPRFRQKAFEMIAIAFSPRMLEYEDRMRGRVELNARVVELRQVNSELERQVADLSKQESQMESRRAEEKIRRQTSAQPAILQKFLTLPAAQSDLVSNVSWDVFLSYPVAERPIAMKLFKSLQSRTRVFMDWFCLLPGQIGKSLCRYTIALISRHSEMAHFHMSELQRAINQMRQGTHRVLPVYLEQNIQAPFGLDQVHGIYWSNSPSGDPVTDLMRSMSASTSMNQSS